MGILMITHDLSTAAHFADRIAVMYLGRIVEEGPAKEVVRNPQHPYTKALISVVPKRDPRDQTEPQILHRRDAEPRQHAGGLPVPPAVPGRGGAVSGRSTRSCTRRPTRRPEHRAACIVTAPGPSADEVGPSGNGRAPA